MAEATQLVVIVGATGSTGKVICERLQRAGLRRDRRRPDVIAGSTLSLDYGRRRGLP